LKVRFAAGNSSVKVSNLHPSVSNELLEEVFSQFGEIEKAVVVTDERGKSLGRGIVDYSRKGFAQNAIKRCSEGNLLLTK
jgi:RNA recognition motif-containing protein